MGSDHRMAVIKAHRLAVRFPPVSSVVRLALVKSPISTQGSLIGLFDVNFGVLSCPYAREFIDGGQYRYTFVANSIRTSVVT